MQSDDPLVTADRARPDVSNSDWEHVRQHRWQGEHLVVLLRKVRERWVVVAEVEQPEGKLLLDILKHIFVALEAGAVIPAYGQNPGRVRSTILLWVVGNFVIVQ